MNQLIRKYETALVALLAVAASITGIRNDFAYDDVRAIVEDQRLHQFRNLWHAFAETYWVPKYSGMLFRPLTSLGFGLQWLIGGGSPMLFHVVSIALYVAVCIAVLSLAKQLFDQTTAFAGAAVFAVHPLHVEAVANVVGQAELGAALLVVVSVTQYLRWTRAGGIGPRRILALCAMYLGAMMVKEHAVVLPALIVAAELLVAAPQGFAQRFRRLLPLMVSMLAVAVVFILWRAAVIGTVTGTYEVNGLAGQSLKVRTLTMLPVILEWIRLFVWPASLSADYSSPRIDVMTSFNAMMIPAVAVIVSSALIVMRSYNDHPRAVFAFAWSALTLLIPSNLIVITGFVLAERTLFLPSVGVALLLGCGLMFLVRAASDAARPVAIGGIVAIVALGVVRSSFRNPIWKNNEVLFRQTVKDEPGSWKAHTMLGELLVNQGKGEGVREMIMGVRMSPKTDVEVRYLTAHRFALAKQCEAAVPVYREAIALAPANAGIRVEAAACMAQTGRLQEGIAVAREGLKLSPGDVRLQQFLELANKNGLAGQLDTGE